MKKVGRNDPCPCGSGLKYKKCHGASNVIALTPEPYNHELEALSQRLLEYATTEFPSEIGDLIINNPQPVLMEDEELMEIYFTLVLAWTILHVPLKQDKTIFELFYEKEKSKIRHERVREIFASWRDVYPRIVEVTAVDEEKLHLHDIRTNEKIELQQHDELDYKGGELLIGVFLPYMQYHSYFLALFSLLDYSEEVKLMLRAYSDAQMKQDYPNVLGEILLGELDLDLDVSWDNPLDEAVAEILTQHLTEKQANEYFISIAVMVWKMFTVKERPVYRKAQAYAAAVEYVMQTIVYGESFQSQENLAKEYNTSAGTISKHSRKIVEVLEDELDSIIEKIESMGEVMPEESSQLSMPLENSMDDFNRALAAQEFESEEDVHEFIKKWNEDKEQFAYTSDEPREIAIGKIKEASMATGQKRKSLIQEALEIYPDTPEAYLLLAEDSRSLEKKFDYYDEAIEAGKRDLGEEFMEENKGHFWMIWETRPYMRTLDVVAHFLDANGFVDDALYFFEEMLGLDPHDHLGARETLLRLYLEEEEYENAEKLIQQFKDDLSASMQFNHVLLHLLRDGITPKAKRLLQKAEKVNPYVIDYLTGKKKLPAETPNTFVLGEESEAIYYAQDTTHLWLDFHALF